LLLCYAARMANKPRIAIVGPGNLGLAFAISLHCAGYTIDAVISRSARKSLTKAQKLAREVGARIFSDSVADTRANLFWFCVPDGEIAPAASAFADQVEWKGKIALHSSGALTSDLLAILRRRGAAVASVHPMMTFVRGDFSRKSKWLSGQLKPGEPQPILTGVPFAIEGDAPAIKIARRVVKDLGGTAYPIRKRDKVAYHAWGTFASPLLTSLLVTAEHVAAMAGVDRKTARQRMIPILRRTLDNYAMRDAADAFSGPIIRGDVEIVKRHMDVLRQNPILYDVYQSLARAALRYLPGKNNTAIRKALASTGKQTNGLLLRKKRT
jgi:predicted short-subunit dehydrogenase-like oxidoreductase (DUF2520 family)